MVESGHRLLRVTVLVLMAMLAECALVGNKERDEFLQARSLVTSGRYSEALQSLRDYEKEFPSSEYASRARFFVAKCYLGMNDPGSARVEFESVIQRFPDSVEAHKSRYKLAMIDLWEGNRERALQRFQAMAEKPDGPLAPEASAMVRYLRP